MSRNLLSAAKMIVCVSVHCCMCVRVRVRACIGVHVSVHTTVYCMYTQVCFSVLEYVMI